MFGHHVEGAKRLCSSLVRVRELAPGVLGCSPVWRLRVSLVLSSVSWLLLLAPVAPPGRPSATSWFRAGSLDRKAGGGAMRCARLAGVRPLAPASP